MKKCPECGNPSYDGAPVCGNCGFEFPKPKVTISKGGDIFQKEKKQSIFYGEENMRIPLPVLERNFITK